MTQKLSEAEETELHGLVTARFERGMTVPDAFFAAENRKIAEACWAMARRFHQGGRLLSFGNGASASDALHVAVEFVHPVIVGKRALPGLALNSDSAALTDLRASTNPGGVFAYQLKVLARPQDIAIGFSSDGQGHNILAALDQARQMGLLTLALVGDKDNFFCQSELDYTFVVPSDDAMTVQETHKTLYHILWELVHVFFEHEGLLK